LAVNVPIHLLADLLELAPSGARLGKPTKTPSILVPLMLLLGSTRHCGTVVLAHLRGAVRNPPAHGSWARQVPGA
jgi:hypothetical protein